LLKHIWCSELLWDEHSRDHIPVGGGIFHTHPDPP